MTARLVMVLDADIAWCAQVCRFLEPHGYPVIVATTQTAALESLKGDVPSAIFVDTSTADHGFCQAMRQFPQFGDVPIFLVSESSARVVYKKGIGVSGYIRKAVLLDHLLLLLSTASANTGSTTDASTRPAA